LKWLMLAMLQASWRRMWGAHYKPFPLGSADVILFASQISDQNVSKYQPMQMLPSKALVLQIL
jgi:hypothetical protein